MSSDRKLPVRGPLSQARTDTGLSRLTHSAPITRINRMPKLLMTACHALARIHNLFSHPACSTIGRNSPCVVTNVLTQELSAQGAVQGNNFCRAHVEQRGIGCWPLDHHGSNGGRAAEEGISDASNAWRGNGRRHGLLVNHPMIKDGEAQD